MLRSFSSADSFKMAVGIILMRILVTRAADAGEFEMYTKEMLFSEISVDDCKMFRVLQDAREGRGAECFYYNKIKTVSMETIINYTLKFAKNQGHLGIGADTLWALALFAEHFGLKDEWEGNFYRALLKNGFNCEQQCDRLLLFKVPKTSVAESVIITQKLILDFLSINGIDFRISKGDRKMNLHIGCNHSEMLPECHEMCKYPKIEIPRNEGMLIPIFQNVVMHCSPFITHEVPEMTKYALLTLIGMIYKGEHVIAADCESWPSEGGFKKVLQIMRSNGGNVVGISCLNQNHDLVTDQSVLNDGHANMKYLGVSFTNRNEDNYENLISFVSATQPSKISLKIASSAFKVKDRILQCTERIPIENLCILNIREFYDAYCAPRRIRAGDNPVHWLKNRQNIEKFSYESSRFGHDALEELHMCRKLYGDKLKTAFIQCPILEGVHHGETAAATSQSQALVKISELIKTSSIETLVLHCERISCPLEERDIIFKNILACKSLKTLIPTFKFVKNSGNDVIIASMNALSMGIVCVPNAEKKRVILGFEFDCFSRTPINGNTPFARRLCTFYKFYEFHPRRHFILSGLNERMTEDFSCRHKSEAME